MRRCFALAAVCCSLPTIAAAAQEHATDTAAHRGWGRPSFFGVWVSGAKSSPFVTRVGIRRRDFFAVGTRVGWAIASDSGVAVSYIVDVVPLAVMTNNPTRYETRSCPPGPACSFLVQYTGTVVGAGASPLGLQMEIGTRSPVSIQLHGNGGLLIFSRPTPDPEARRLNFTASAGAAIEIELARRLGVSVGYVWHHTSNAGTAPANPGLDSHMLVVGLVRRREHRQASETASAR